MSKVELLYGCRNILGEGITWSQEDQTLFWLDIGNISKVYKLNINNDTKEFFEIPEIITNVSHYTKYFADN